MTVSSTSFTLMMGIIMQTVVTANAVPDHAANNCSSCRCEEVRKCGKDSLYWHRYRFSLEFEERGGYYDVQSHRFLRLTLPPCTTCEWVVFSTSKKRLRLTFSQFFLGFGDKLNIYDGYPNSSRLAVTYTTGDKPVDLVSSGNTMTIMLVTDNCDLEPYIEVSLETTDCGKLFYLQTGKAISKQIQSPNFPKQYPNNLDCLWMFVRHGGLLLSADITIKSISTSGQQDKLKIQEFFESSKQNDSVYKFYGRKVRKQKMVKIRNSPGFIIRFTSNSRNRGKGFSLKAKTFPSALYCRSPIPPENGTVEIRNFGKTAVYSCCANYTLVGNQEQSCTYKGWMPRSKPRCKDYCSTCGRRQYVDVGEGCIDLIFIADCSVNVGVVNFNQTLKFVYRSASLFDIDSGNARVALITFDDEVYPRIQLGEKKTLKETVRAIYETNFCGGATATRKVMRYVRENVISMSRPDCKRAIFLFSGGFNNWAADVVRDANALKQQNDLEIFTIALPTDNAKFESFLLMSVASYPDYYYRLGNAGMLGDVLKMTFRIKIDYCNSCGRTDAHKCRHPHNGVCLSEIGAWPWMVGIYRLEGQNPVFHCGGAIINDCMILTAAHCLVKDPLVPVYYQLQELLVVVGDTRRYVKEFSEKTYTIENALMHPEYEEGGKYNRDIALLKLSCNITCSPFVRKICLPTPQDSIFYHAGSMCIVAGWAAGKSTSMKELHLPIADKDTCINNTSPQYQKDVTNYTVCAGDGTGNNDVYDGSSGDPLFVKRKKQTEFEEDSYVIVGIVSWGEGRGQPKKYGIFTHVLNLVDWVRNQTATHRCPLASLDHGEKQKCPDPPLKLL